MTARDPEAAAREIAEKYVDDCLAHRLPDLRKILANAIRDAREEGRRQGFEEADAALLEFAREAVQRQCGGHIRTALSDFADILRARVAVREEGRKPLEVVTVETALKGMRAAFRRGVEEAATIALGRRQHNAQLAREEGEMLRSALRFHHAAEEARTIEELIRAIAATEAKDGA